MKTGQRGAVRDGQNGVIVEEYVNGGLFQSDTGARFTVLVGEFRSDMEHVLGKRPLGAHAFDHIRKGDGMHYKRVAKRGVVQEVWVRRLVSYLPDVTKIQRRYPAAPTRGRKWAAV